MKKIFLAFAAAAVMLAGCRQQQEKKSDMQYRPLGNTGLMVSEISIGCGGFEKLDSAASLELMTMALDSGMNYIDIYDANPKTRSNIGYALQGRRDEMIIQGHIGTSGRAGSTPAPATSTPPRPVSRISSHAWAPTISRWA